jgi:sec-independent protein translocase protein TatB
MLSLSPAKLLVILVVALIVLGPEKLPQMARQLGAFWHDLRQWRGRLESEVRGTFPNLPPPEEVARVVRSPLAFLDRLADEHERSLADTGDGSTGATEDPAPPPASGSHQGPAPPPEAASNGAQANGSASSGPRTNGDGVVNGAANFLSPQSPGPVAISPDDPSMN